MSGEVWVAVTVRNGKVGDLEVLDLPPAWDPLPGQTFHRANVNGGDSVEVTPHARRRAAGPDGPYLLLTPPGTFGDGFNLHYANIATPSTFLRQWPAESDATEVVAAARAAGDALGLPVYRRWADGTLTLEP